MDKAKNKMKQNKKMFTTGVLERIIDLKSVSGFELS